LNKQSVEQKQEDGKMKNLTVYFLILPLILTLGCQIEVNIEAEKTSIETLFNNYSDAWKDLDIDKFSKMFLTSGDLIIITNEKKFIGWDSWKNSLIDFFNSASDVVVKFKDPLIYVHPTGKVAWLSVLEDADWMQDGESLSIRDMRVTWVLEKINGNWEIVQGHWSLVSTF
jgi:ketosteroid isomerase-like protein